MTLLSSFLRYRPEVFVLAIALAVASCARNDTPEEAAEEVGGSSAVGVTTAFDFDTANPEEVRAALARDGRVAVRGTTFAFDSADLTDAGKAQVGKIGQVMNDNPGLKLAVVGHTDSTGRFEYNVGLSERRANTIVTALQTDANIANDRLVAVGVGPISPVAPNDTEANRSQNRRVEFVAIQ